MKAQAPVARILISAAVLSGVYGAFGKAASSFAVITVLLVALVVRTRLSVVTVAAGARDASVKGSVLARDGAVLAAVGPMQRGGTDETANGNPRRGEGHLPEVFAVVGAEEIANPVRRRPARRNRTGGGDPRHGFLL